MIAPCVGPSSRVKALRDASAASTETPWNHAIHARRSRPSGSIQRKSGSSSKDAASVRAASSRSSARSARVCIAARVSTR
ncbi:MAG: hypothetical protein R3A52_00305 [Polyangiales bacterium]